jgi:hypothetical protein
MDGLDDVFESDEEEVAVDSTRGTLSKIRRILGSPTGIPFFGPDGINYWMRTSLRDGFCSSVIRWVYRSGTVRI